jgi:esterase/lipase superfamily enzyme
MMPRMEDKSMRVYFATNRNPNNPDKPTDFGNTFSVNGLTDLRFGWAEFDTKRKNLDKYTLTVADENLEVTPAAAKVRDLSAQKLGSREVFAEVQREMRTKKQDCVVAIHGYNTTFAGGLQRAAQLKAFYADRPMTFFVFSWPSDGSLLPFKAYASDRDDARASGVALGRGLQKLACFLRESKPEAYCDQSIHLMAHSMGNYALRWALQAIQGNTGSQLRRLLDQVLLFAADEDDDAFELGHKLQSLPDMARRVTVYHHPGDKALMLSDVTKGNPDRLGAGGPRNSRLLPDKVSVVNCEPVIGLLPEIAAHNYDHHNAAVRRDVLAVLSGTDPASIKTRQYLAETRSYRLKRAATA